MGHPAVFSVQPFPQSKLIGEFDLTTDLGGSAGFTDGPNQTFIDGATSSRFEPGFNEMLRVWLTKRQCPAVAPKLAFKRGASHLRFG